MQLRTVKKPKIKDFDFGANTVNEIISSRKNSHSKEQGEKDVQESSNENSNLTNDNEIKSRHKLRNPSGNYQGKYKKMNSGKYLYKLNNSDKKPINKKKQLRFLPLELVQTFKKFLNKLNKKEDENMLNKKKKREDKLEQVTSKQKTGEIQDNYNKKMMNKMQNLQQFHPMAEYDYAHPYMMKSPYDLYYQQNYLENLKSQGFPIDNAQMFYRMNKDFMKYYNVPEYYYRGQFPPHPYNYEQELKPKGESIFNLINDKESLSRINKIANQGVNPIVAAFYIKSVQQNRAKANEPSNPTRRAPVPVNSIPLDEKEENEEGQTKIITNNTNHQNNTSYDSKDKDKDNDKDKSLKDPTDTHSNEITKNNLNDKIVNINENTSNNANKAMNSEYKDSFSSTNGNMVYKNSAISSEKELKTVNFNDINNLSNIAQNINERSNQEKESKSSPNLMKKQTNNFPKSSHVISSSNLLPPNSRFINSQMMPMNPFDKMNSSFTKTNFTEDLNQYTAQQLNTVSNMVKRIKENKLSELIEKDNFNSGSSLKK